MTKPVPKSLTVLIPVYNEVDNIAICVQRVIDAPKRDLPFDIVISDNVSTDGTREVLAGFSDPRITVVLREKHSGKGANIRSALERATGDIVLIQDADLEYNPLDYPDILLPFFEADADVVYGSRLSAAKYFRVIGVLNFAANKILTWTANILYDRIFSDIETATKAFRREVLVSLNLKSEGFEIEPEITAKISRRRYAIFETPIRHAARGYDEGKKVRWWHFFTSIWALIKWRFKD